MARWYGRSTNACQASEACRIFRCQLLISLFVVEPDGGVRRPNRSDERSSITGHGNPLLFSKTGGDLFRRSIRKSLPPDVKRPSRVRAHIHPLAVGRPRARGTSCIFRSDESLRPASVKWHYATLTCRSDHGAYPWPQPNMCGTCQVAFRCTRITRPRRRRLRFPPAFPAKSGC
jgi:hypothetical protein